MNHTGTLTRATKLLRTRALPVFVLALGVSLAFTAIASARVLRVAQSHPPGTAAAQFNSIQAAVDAARPGDWILVAPGDYHERGDYTTHQPTDEAGAGVLITTPDIHLRGLDRNGVVVDGTKPGSPNCSPAAGDQDFGPNGLGRNGVEVFKADGVTWRISPPATSSAAPAAAATRSGSTAATAAARSAWARSGRLPLGDLDLLRRHRRTRGHLRDLHLELARAGGDRPLLRQQHERRQLLHRRLPRLQPGARPTPTAEGERTGLLGHQLRRPPGDRELRVGPQQHRHRHQLAEQR